MLKELQAGKQTSFGAIMEGVANAYGIPSIDLGVEIAKDSPKYNFRISSRSFTSVFRRRRS
jgi:hypothetical protein